MIIQVCRNCERSKPVVDAALKLKKQFGAQITVELIDCLDQCHYPPAASVNGQLIIWADEVKLRTVVSRLKRSNG